MTQALAGFNQNGLFMATDGRATRFAAGGEPEFIQVQKLFPLGKNCAILGGGAGVSVPLSLALSREISRRRGLYGLEEVVEWALPFLSQGYAAYLQEHGPEPEGFRRIYFILGGYDPSMPPPAYQLFLLGSDDNELPLRPMPVGNQVVMPRNLGMEMRLQKGLAAGLPLDQLLASSKDFLEKQAQLKEEVGPPFYYATITAEGYREITS